MDSTRLAACPNPLADPAGSPGAAAVARGRRPQFIDDPLVEQLYAATQTLTVELSVTRERLDTVERLLAERDVLSRAQIDAYRPGAAASAERAQLQQGLLHRVWRSLLRR